MGSESWWLARKQVDRRPLNRAQRGAIAVASVLLLTVLYLYLVPFPGPPGSAGASRTVDIYRKGDRAWCPPFAYLRLRNPLTADQGHFACMVEGVRRRSQANMLLFVALAGGGLALWILRDPPEPEQDDGPTGT